MPLWRLINCQFTEQLGKRNNTSILCQCLQTSQVYFQVNFPLYFRKMHLEFSEIYKTGKKLYYPCTKEKYNIVTSQGIIYVSCLFWLALELPGGLFKTNAQVSAQLSYVLSLDEKSGPR